MKVYDIGFFKDHKDEFEKLGKAYIFGEDDYAIQRVIYKKNDEYFILYNGTFSQVSKLYESDGKWYFGL